MLENPIPVYKTETEKRTKIKQLSQEEEMKIWNTKESIKLTIAELSALSILLKFDIGRNENSSEEWQQNEVSRSKAIRKKIKKVLDNSEEYKKLEGQEKFW